MWASILMRYSPPCLRLPLGSLAAAGTYLLCHHLSSSLIGVIEPYLFEPDTNSKEEELQLTIDTISICGADFKSVHH